MKYIVYYICMVCYSLQSTFTFIKSLLHSHAHLMGQNGPGNQDSEIWNDLVKITDGFMAQMADLGLKLEFLSPNPLHFLL